MKYEVLRSETVASLQDLPRDVKSYTDWEGFTNGQALLEGVKARLAESGVKWEEVNQLTQIMFMHYMFECADATSIKEILDDKQMVLNAFWAIQYVTEMDWPRAFAHIE